MARASMRPGFRVGSDTTRAAGQRTASARERAANVESRRAIIALHSAASTKLASKLLRASA